MLDILLWMVSQDMVGFLGCKLTLLDNVELLVSQQPRPFSSGLLSIHSLPKLFFVLGIVMYQGAAHCT